MVDVRIAVDAWPRGFLDDGDSGADHPASRVAEQRDVRRIAPQLGRSSLHGAKCTDHGFGLLPVRLVALRLGEGLDLVDHGPRRNDDERPAFGHGGGEGFHPRAVPFGAVEHDDDGRRGTLCSGATGREDVGCVATDIDVANDGAADRGARGGSGAGRGAVTSGSACDE